MVGIDPRPGLYVTPLTPWWRCAALLLSLAVTVALALTGAPRAAQAFCGFYVGGADATLFNNATQVVLLRDGTRTVLSMQNNYQGPPERFAMVVPVPVVLQKENVKTLPREIFRKVDQLAAPRLVEYWEQDPCPKPQPRGGPPRMPMRALDLAAPMAAAPGGGLGVKIEAQFTVAEYEIVILSAKDSLGLDTWIRREGYKIPAGAEPYLRPYVQAGMKFFVAKVDPTKVKFEERGPNREKQAMLSPLRFHYDTETFSLPVRLGLMNSAGTQDLIVHVLSRGQRYEVANFDNVSIPTNLDVSENARARFGEFYAALLDRTLGNNPGAVITEYAWDASTCDPCPGPTLDMADLMTLGADVISTAPGAAPPPPPVAPPKPPATAAGAPPPAAAPPPAPPIRRPPPGFGGGGGFVITRLHARYKKDALGEDLVFRAAPPIVGGREFLVGTDPSGRKLEQGAVPGQVNNFQARYAIRHPWKGPIACKNPVRGVWGGPPAGVAGDMRPRPALDLAFAPRGALDLGTILPADRIEPALQTASLLSKGSPLPKPPDPPPPNADPNAMPPPPPPPPPVAPKEGGCAGCRTAGTASPSGALFAVAALAAAWIARRRANRRTRR